MYDMKYEKNPINWKLLKIPVGEIFLARNPAKSFSSVFLIALHILGWSAGTFLVWVPRGFFVLAVSVSRLLDVLI